MEMMSRENAELFAIQIATASVPWQNVSPTQFDDRMAAALEIYDNVMDKLAGRIEDGLSV